MKKSALSILIAVTMLLSGCGAEKAAKTDDNSGSQAASTTKKISWDSDDISWKKDKSPVTLSCYIDFSWYAVDKWGQDDVSKEITKRTGVTLNVTKGTDLNQLQVLLASDQLPDLVFTANQVDRFHNSDVSYAYDDLIKKYCPEFKSLIDPVQSALNTDDDGHIYAIKTHYLSNEDWKDPRALGSTGDTGFFIRQDIMQALGNPKLESLEDLDNIYKMVKQKYPDMIVYLPHTGWGTPFMEYMGVDSGVPYKDKNGKLTLGWANPAYADFLKYYNGLFRNGYVSQEALTYKAEQFTQIINSGKVFSASYNTSLGDVTNKFYDKNGIKAKFEPVKPLTYKGEMKFSPTDYNIGFASFFITKKNKNPKRSILFAEFLKSPEGDQLAQWGIEGVHYTKADGGLIKRTDKYNNETAQQSGVPYWYFMANGINDSISASSKAISSPDYHTQLDVMQARKKYYKRDPALNFVWPKADTDEFNINTKLGQLYSTAEASIITASSEKDAQSKYDKLVSDAKKTGIDKLSDYMTKAYKKAKTKYDNALKQK